MKSRRPPIPTCIPTDGAVGDGRGCGAVAGNPAAIVLCPISDDDAVGDGWGGVPALNPTARRHHSNPVRDGKPIEDRP